VHLGLRTMGVSAREPDFLTSMVLERATFAFNVRGSWSNCRCALDSTILPLPGNQLNLPSHPLVEARRRIAADTRQSPSSTLRQHSGR
jgi:hypothetical protein